MFFLALAVRAIYLIEWHDTVLATVLLGDGAEYDRWARRIASGDWIGGRVFYQAPMYPYFVALVYRWLGADLDVLRMAQAVLGSVSCVLVALAGRRFFDARVGWVAGGLLAVYAPAIYFDGLVQKGVLGGLLMSLLLVTLGEFRQRGSWPWLSAGGITLGLFALTRENALALVPVVATWAILAEPATGGSPSAKRGPTSSLRLLRLAALVAGLAAVLVPVGLRNQALGGRFLLTTSQLGPNFYIGNHPGADGRYVPLRAGRGSVLYERQDATEMAEAALGRKLEPAGVSRYWRRQALEEIAEHPVAWLGLLGRKWQLTWHADEIMDTDSIEAHREHSVLLRVLGSVWHFGVLAPLAAVGIWMRRREWRRLWLLHALLLALAAAVTLFFVMARYRYPLTPVLALFAAAALLELGRLVREGRIRSLTAPAGVFALAAVLSNWPLAAPLDPRTVTYYSLGAALVELGRAEEALAPLERALEIDPDFVDARFKLGDAITTLGRPAEALPHLREAVRRDPQHADVRTALGNALLASGAEEEAAAQYAAALKIRPDSRSALNNLAVLLVGRGHPDEAIPLWERVLATSPDDVEALTNLGRVLAAIGQAERAAGLLERALAIDPDHEAARRGLAEARGESSPRQSM